MDHFKGVRPLFREGKYDEAERALQKALSAPPRAGREVFERGRRAEVSTLLAQVKAKRG